MRVTFSQSVIHFHGEITIIVQGLILVDPYLQKVGIFFLL